MTTAKSPNPIGYCACCEARAPLSDAGLLCELCAAHEPLRAAFEEGQARLRGDLLMPDPTPC